MDNLYIGGLDYSPTGIYILKMNITPTAEVREKVSETILSKIKALQPDAQIIVLDQNFDQVSAASDEVMEGLGWIKKENEEAIK